MKILNTYFDGEVVLFEPDVIEDDRGYFYESYRDTILPYKVDFVQENVSYTKKCGTIRGIHFQNKPYAQAKLVKVLQGKVVDVIVDLRKDSSTYKQWIMFYLSSDDKRQLFIPEGFGHSFRTLTDNVIFSYKVSNYYNKECDRSIRYNDDSIKIFWDKVDESLMSEKDRNAPKLKDSDCNF